MVEKVCTWHATSVAEEASVAPPNSRSWSPPRRRSPAGAPGSSRSYARVVERLEAGRRANAPAGAGLGNLPEAAVGTPPPSAARQAEERQSQAEANGGVVQREPVDAASRGGDL